MNLALYKTLPLFLLLFAGTLASAKKHPALGEVPKPVKKEGLDFIENKGQWANESRYKTEIPGGVMFLTDKGFVYNFINTGDLHDYVEDMEHQGTSKKIIHGHAYKVNFSGANTPTFEGSQQRSHYHNYFIDNDPSRWKGHVGLYGNVRYKNIYNGTDLVIYSTNSQSAKYDFVVKAGADPSQIAMTFDGITPEMDQQGNLHIKTSVNEITEKAPYTYQVINNQKVVVPSKYKLVKGVLSFEFPQGYNTAYDLVIDPILVFASFSGSTGSSAFYAHSTTYDILGNTYTAALSSGTGWPTTTGAYQTTYPGSQTASITKINATGSAIVYATYFGGTGGNCQPNTLRVNSNNELFLAGNVSTANMPVTAGAFQSTLSGSSDVYVTHFSQDGATLLGSTYIGGTGLEACLAGSTFLYSSLGSSAEAINPVEITFANNGSVWCTSNSGSTNFPLTTNAAQATNAGSHDAVVFNLSADCSNLLYSTYFGDSGWDGGVAIELDPANTQVVVAGWTQSSSLPNTTGKFQPTNAGSNDGFVTTYNATALTNTGTTFLGTAGADHAHRIAFDAGGNIYIAGRASDGSYPVTTNAYSIANGKIFVQKLNSTLVTGLASTTLASTTSTTVVPSAMIVDICGNILLATISSGAQADMPLTPDAFDITPRPFWFCALTPNFGDLFFGSYFGSNSDHYHPGVARMDPNGIIYHSVCASGDPATINFPTTPGSFAPNKLNGFTNDNITFKFNFEATGVQSNFVLDPNLNLNDTGCVPFTVHFQNLSSSAVDYTWNFDDGSPTSSAVNVSHTYTVPGVYNISLHASNDTSCITDDTAYMTVVVLQTNPPDFIVNDTTVCTFTQAIDIGLTLNNPSPNNTILWEPATGILTAPNQPIITVDPSVNNVYWVTVKDTIPGICGFSATDTVHIDLSPRVLDIINNDTVVCKGAMIPITAVGTPGYTYLWSPAIGVSDTIVLQPIITINQPNLYTLTASYPNCPDTAVQINFDMHFIPDLELGPDKFVCQWTDVALESTVTPFRNDYTYQWTPATPNLSNPTGPNTHFNSDTTITYHLNVQTPIGCADNDSIKITVYPGAFGAIASDTGYCPGNQAQLWATGGVNYNWTPAYGLSDSSIANPVASPGTTTYYTVYITDQHNCSDTEKVTVYVYPEAVLALPDSVNVYPGEQYHVEPETNGLYFTWFPPSGLSNSTISDPLMSPEVRTRYYVTATTEHGCIVSDSMDALVKETVIDMPNAFTPSSVNNLFKPSKRGIAQLKSFNIFNRWGNKVYSSTNIEEGWDGTYKGKEQPMGVYIYAIEAVSDNGKTFTKQGNVTLIR
ncbi:MAG: gliding motility-associated C-terminal domain-containing protein [Taibaiella sp.]|jgi:gliding motility-associated-like protein